MLVYNLKVHWNRGGGGGSAYSHVAADSPALSTELEIAREDKEVRIRGENAIAKYQQRPSEYPNQKALLEFLKKQPAQTQTLIVHYSNQRQQEQWGTTTTATSADDEWKGVAIILSPQEKDMIYLLGKPQYRDDTLILWRRQENPQAYFSLLPELQELRFEDRKILHLIVNINVDINKFSKKPLSLNKWILEKSINEDESIADLLNEILNWKKGKGRRASV